MIKGIPNPNEKANNIEIPFNNDPSRDAINKADPKKVPTHGVQLIENGFTKINWFEL